MYTMLKPGYAENNSGKTFRGIYLYTVRGRKEKIKVMTDRGIQGSKRSS